MHFLDRAEKRFGHLALPGIIRILVGFKFLAILLMAISGANGYDYGSFLVFDKELIKQGEWWRLITYIFMTRTLSPIWIIFELLVLWIIGNGIERTWGSFRLNLYFFLGILLTTIAAFFFTPPTEEAYFSITRFVFTASLFFCFACLHPNTEFLLFFVLPVKVKYLAYITGGIIALSFLGASWSFKLAILLTLGNFLLVFSPSFLHNLRQREKTSSRKVKFEKKKIKESEAFHTCVTCGKTDIDDEHLEFRVSKDGHEYCTHCLRDDKE